jgi:hypothetical protein
VVSYLQEIILWLIGKDLLPSQICCLLSIELDSLTLKHLPLIPRFVKISFYNQSIIKISTTLLPREVSHDPRDNIQVALRKSSRIINKQLMQTFKRSASPKESKVPIIIKSSSLSSSEKSKSASLRTPKKGSHKNNNDGVDSKINLSSKISLRGSPDLSRGIEMF